VTTADVRVLAGDDRVREVRRMLGGDPESDVSRRTRASCSTRRRAAPAAPRGGARQQPEPALAGGAPATRGRRRR
jgi:hypothetical protein